MLHAIHAVVAEMKCEIAKGQRYPILRAAVASMSEADWARVPEWITDVAKELEDNPNRKVRVRSRAERGKERGGTTKKHRRGRKAHYDEAQDREWWDTWMAYKKAKSEEARTATHKTFVEAYPTFKGIYGAYGGKNDDPVERLRDRILSMRTARALNQLKQSR